MNGSACLTEFQNASQVWPGKCASRRIRDRARDHDRQRNACRCKGAFDGEDRGLGIQRVEDRFDHQKVDTAFDQGTRRLFVVSTRVAN